VQCLTATNTGGAAADWRHRSARTYRWRIGGVGATVRHSYSRSSRKSWPSPRVALPSVWWLVNFVWDADHQTLENVFDETRHSVTSSLGNYREEGITSMFALVVECQSKPGRSKLVSNKLQNNVLPILQKQRGFVDFLTFSDKTDPERLLCISFWISQEDADEYDNQYYYATIDMLEPLLDFPATLETFEVTGSTAHRIAIGRTA
jgi:quinol monooxygenase YgiN